MATYIIRRILWMIPTFFVISLVVFAIINLAPGDPGDMAAAQGQETAGQSNTKGEARRIFKEQFNLDKPVLLNIRYWLDKKDVERELSLIARQQYMFGVTLDKNENDIAANFSRWFEKHDCELSPKAAVEEWVIGDEQSPLCAHAAGAAGAKWCTEPVEFSAVRLYNTVAVFSGRYPATEEEQAVYGIAREGRDGVNVKEITRRLKQKAPEYLDIIACQPQLAKGLVPALHSLKKTILLDGSRQKQLNAGSISKEFRAAVEPYRLLSNKAKVREWLIYDPKTQKQYRVIRTGKLCNVYQTGKKYRDKELIDAEEKLADYGHYAIPHLVAIIKDTDNEEIRYAAMSKFVENARGRSQFKKKQYHRMWGMVAQVGMQIDALAEKFDDNNPKLEKEQGKDAYRKQIVSFVNSEIALYNKKLDDLRYLKNDRMGIRKQKIEGIADWYWKHDKWYSYSAWDKVKISLLDTRFAKYWWNLFHLDFGISNQDKRPVIETVAHRIRYSLCLSFTALLLAYLIAVPLGIYSAVKQNSLGDRISALILFMLYSLPSFFVGTLLLEFFSQGGSYWKLFPVGGFSNVNAFSKLTTWGQLGDIFWHIVLPVICLTYGGLASLSRYGRSGVIEVIRSDYIKTARAKGLPEYLVILRHAVRNGMIPILTLLGSVLPVLIGGSIVIEVIFAIPGMGALTIESIGFRDYNTIMCISLSSAVLVMVGILLSDISYALLDPRISFK